MSNFTCVTESSTMSIVSYYSAFPPSLSFHVCSREQPQHRCSTMDCRSPGRSVEPASEACFFIMLNLKLLTLQGAVSKALGAHFSSTKNNSVGDNLLPKCFVWNLSRLSPEKHIQSWQSSGPKYSSVCLWTYNNDCMRQLTAVSPIMSFVYTIPNKAVIGTCAECIYREIEIHNIC